MDRFGDTVHSGMKKALAQFVVLQYPDGVWKLGVINDFGNGWE